MSSRETSQTASYYLFDAINEAARIKGFVSSVSKAPVVIAYEMFAAADFEVSANSQFLLLITVLEVLAEPRERPEACIALVDELLQRAERGIADATANSDAEMQLAFKALKDSAIHLRRESITSSIRKLATEASKVLGDPNPQDAGTRAAKLYGKRSKLVHKGESVSLGDVAETRQLVRECLSVRIGCSTGIRE
jgi:hypothetical protein